MRPFIVKQLDYDLTPVAGLALVGHHLNRLAPVFKQLDGALPVKNGVVNSDVLRRALPIAVKVVRQAAYYTPAKVPKLTIPGVERPDIYAPTLLS